MARRNQTGMTFLEVVFAVVISSASVALFVFVVGLFDKQQVVRMFEKTLEQYRQQIREAEEDDQLKSSLLLELGQRRDLMPESLDVLLDQAMNQNEMVRNAALLAVGDLGEIVTPHLEKRLKSKTEREYLMGAAGVIALGPKAANWTDLLLENINSPNYRIKLQSLFALEKVGPDAIRGLDQYIALLDDEQFNVHLAVCRVLTMLGPVANKATPRLMEMAQNGQFSSSRSMACVALGALGPVEGHDVVGVLTAKLDSFTLPEKERALLGLGQLGPLAKDALPKIKDLMGDSTLSENRETRSCMPQAALAYFLISDDMETTLKTLRRTARSINFEAQTIDAIAGMGDKGGPAVPILIGKLGSPEPSIRESALWALPRMGKAALSARDTVQALINSDDDLIIRRSAKIVLEELDKFAK